MTYPDFTAEVYPEHRTENLLDVRREPTPITEVITDGDEVIYKLHKGATVVFNADTQMPLATAEESFSVFGIHANVLAEIGLGNTYSLLVFDRGPDSQGREEPLSYFGGKTVSDRFFLATQRALIQTGIKVGFNQPIPEDVIGIVEFCMGSHVELGRSREYSYNGMLDTGAMPDTVSRKHAAIGVGYDNSVHVSDCSSANLTTVRLASDR